MIVSFAEFTPEAAGETVNRLVAEAVKVNDELWAKAQTAEQRARIENWYVTAKAWMDMSYLAVADEASLTEWGRLGVKIMGNAQDYANEINDTEFSARVGDFIRRIPKSISDTLVGTVNIAGDTVDAAAERGGKAAEKLGQSAGWTVLWIGLGLAAAAYLLTKSGGSVRLPFVTLGKR